MASKTTLKVAMALGGALLLSGCDNTNLPAFLKNSNKDAEGAMVSQSRGGRTTERDVEAPEIFQVAEKGLWDGRPSLGGIWVAHPDAKDPERVIVRNQANGKSVVGALFRKERDIPGPRFQVSSDAAEALGMLAGAPAELSVTAMRKEEVPEKAEEPAEDLNAPDAIEQKSLEDPIAAAAAALDKTEDSAKAVAAAKSAPQPKPSTTAPASKLSKPFAQVGIFSVEANANNTAAALRKAGMTPAVKSGTSNDKKFWRVIVGPVSTKKEQSALLKKIKGLGFADAYFVSN